MKSCAVLKTKSISPYMLMTCGAKVTPTKRTASRPEPVEVLVVAVERHGEHGVAFRSKVIFWPASFHTVVEPRPSSTEIISSKSWRWGASLPPGGISQT